MSPGLSEKLSAHVTHNEEHLLGVVQDKLPESTKDISCIFLRRCNLCGEGPFSLDDISKAPMRIGLGVVLYLKCRNCKEESSIRTYDSHRAGKRGPEAVTLNTRAVLSMLHTGQGHSHLNADLSILGIGSLSSRTYKKTRTRGWIGCGIGRQRKLYTLQGKGKR